ncbi:MAG: cytochrome c [Fodinibius sp.]|nr:cytochrome c [Fodinibius sp.]
MYHTSEPYRRSQNVPEEEVKENYDVDLASLKESYQKKIAEAEAKKQAQSESGGGEVSVERGKTIASNNACTTCHSVDGSRMVGPTWKNLYGNERPLENGETVVADEEYLRESIVEPGAKIAQGYPPAMVAYDQLSDSEINSLIAYIKSLSENAEQ